MSQELSVSLLSFKMTVDLPSYLYLFRGVSLYRKVNKRSQKSIPFSVIGEQSVYSKYIFGL